MEHVEVLRRMRNEWPLATDEGPALDAAIASLTAQQPPAEAHCTTCSCVPGMTPAVRLDTTPAEKEGAVRDHLIRIGWAPPPEAQAQPVAWFPTYGNGKLVRNYGDGSPVPASKTKEEAEQAKRCHLGATGPVIPLYAHPPPSAPVGVEGLRALKAKYQQHIDADHFPYHFWRDLEAALAQQPAAVDGDNPYPAPRNRQEAAALAKLALAYLGVTSAHIDAAVARCETDLAAQQGGEA